MRCLLFLFFLLFATALSAQTKKRYRDTVINGKTYHHVDDAPFKGYYHYVEQMPEPGYDFNQYFQAHFRYPDSMEEMITTIVFSFIVNEDGSISNCKIIKGKELEKEILEVTNKMPKWKPGKQKGKPVKVEYTTKMHIHLQ